MPSKETPEKEFSQLLIQQNEWQQKLIESQKEIIALHKKIEQLTPPAPDDDINWNKVSGGKTSSEVLETGDFDDLRALSQWILKFGEKYIKPYVHFRAYTEMMAHMSRGISQRMAELETQKEFEQPDSATKTNQPEKPTTRDNQITLFPPDDD
jgi:hypothetical protein